MTDGRLIRHAMAMLPVPHRALIYRAYYLGRTTAQIAELHEAMRELHRILRGAHAAV
jgi:RNA polymerase sigma-70 factor (ECF subfamily)